MKAVRFLGGGQLRVVELPTPTPGPGQVLVKILASAVCGSERGDYLGEINPGRVHISGHEAVGDVVDPNGSKRFRENDRVCVQIMNGCGVCPYCKKGLPTFCESLRYENGCHAQYVAMPETCFVPIDADIPPQTAVLLGGDLLGVAWRAIRQLSLEKDELVFVSGCGPIGLGVSFVLKALGAKVIIAEPHPFRRAYALEKIGVDLALDPSEVNVPEALRDSCHGIGPRITVECSGNPEAQLQALNVTRCQGHVMLCGENYRGLTIIPSLQIIHKELNIHGAFYFAPSDVPEIVAQYRRGMDPSPLVSHFDSIDRAPALFDAFFAGRTGKVVLNPWI